MKLKYSLIGLMLTSIDVVFGITSSKTIPISGTKTIPTTGITSKTIPTSTSTGKTVPTRTTTGKTIPTTYSITTLNPNDFWYYKSDGVYRKILNTKCGTNSRSLETYKKCLDSNEISSNIYGKYIKFSYENSTKTVPAYDTNVYPKGNCATKGGWFGMYMNSAIKDCDEKQAELHHIGGSCPGNSGSYYCALKHTKTVNEMKIIPYVNPSYVSSTGDKEDTYYDNSDELTSVEKPICSNDGGNSTYHCCRRGRDYPVSVALVDVYGVWGIQLFDQKYDWCYYDGMEPVIPFPSTTSKYSPPISTTTTKVPLTIFTTTTTTKVPPTISTTTTTTKVPPTITTTTTTTKVPPTISTTTTTTKVPPTITTTTTTTKVSPTISTTTTTTKVPPTITTTTTTTKVPPTISTTTSSSCVPKTLTFTLTERETVTEKEYVTVTVTDYSASETTPSERCSGKWAQCGGIGYKGPTCCESGFTCRKLNEYYSQCV